MLTQVHARQRAKADLPPPLVGIAAIERVLLRQASGPLPEKSLIVAVICQAMIDARSSVTAQRRSGRAFLTGPDLEAWTLWVDLNPAFVRELARKTYYLPDAVASGRNPGHEDAANRGRHAGL